MCLQSNIDVQKTQHCPINKDIVFGVDPDCVCVFINITFGSLIKFGLFMGKPDFVAYKQVRTTKAQSSLFIVHPCSLLSVLVVHLFG